MHTCQRNMDHLCWNLTWNCCPVNLLKKLEKGKKPPIETCLSSLTEHTLTLPFSLVFHINIYAMYQATMSMSPWQVPSLRRLSPFGTRHSGLPQWCHTLALLLFSPSLALPVAHFSIFPHFIFYDDDDVCVPYCYSSLLSSTLPCLQANMKMSSVSKCVGVSPGAPDSLSFSLPDIKSTVIKLFVNLWRLQHLTTELHQRLKNTESKWGCNGSGVGPWPLIELKDMGNRERRKRDRLTAYRGWGGEEGGRRRVTQEFRNERRGQTARTKNVRQGQTKPYN